MLKPTGTKRLLGRRIASPTADINFTLDDGPLGHDKPWCNDVAKDRACRSKLDLLPGSHVSRHRTANRDVLCDQVRFNRGARSDGQAMVAEFDRSRHVAINRQIFSADDLAPDSDRSSNPRSQSAFIKRCSRIRHRLWLHSFARAIRVPHPVSPFRIPVVYYSHENRQHATLGAALIGVDGLAAEGVQNAEAEGGQVGRVVSEELIPNAGKRSRSG